MKLRGIVQIPQSRRVPKTPQTGIHAWQIARMSRGLINSLLLLLILFLPAAGVKALPFRLAIG